MKKPDKKKKKIRKSKVLLMVLIIAVALIFFTISGIEIVRLNRTNAEKQARLERLEQLLAEQEQRRDDLTEEAIYVQTRKYIEEKAKSIGYVYPDEIIFRKEDD